MLLHNFFRTLGVLALATTCVVVFAAEIRQWTDNTGKFSIEAELVEIRRDSVVLRKRGGKKVAVPLARLSDADRQYLKNLEKRGEKPPANASSASPLAYDDALSEPPLWNDKNVPFDLAGFLRAPPAEENAAPLYLEAFTEFSSEMLDLVLGQYSKLPADRQSEYERLHKMFRDRSRKYERFEEAWQSDPSSVDTEEVDAWLAEYDTGFQKLAAAQQRPKCKFQTGYSMHSLAVHQQVTRQVARVIAWRTRRDLARGDVERPLDDLKLLLRMSRDLRPGGFAVAQLVSVALDGQSCERVREILNAPGVEARVCDRLLTQLTEHESQSIDMVAEFQRAEYIIARQGLYDLQHRTGSFDPMLMQEIWGIEGDMKSQLVCFKIFLDLEGSNNPLKMGKEAVRLKSRLLPGAWTGGEMLSGEDYAREVDVLNRFYATILALPDEPNFRRREAEIQAAMAPVNETTLALYAVPAATTVVLAIRRREAQIRGTQCLVALRRWQLEHSDTPPDLETLVKAAAMSNVPVDPFSGQPLRMATIDGKPAIYSIGPDGKDDQAKVEWNYGPRKLGDFIFRLDAPSQ